MRKLAHALVFLLLAGLFMPSALEAKGKTHDVTTQVVSVDLKAKSLTFKGEKGQDMTAPVMESALEDLKKLKPGDAIVLTCQDTETGEHEGISAIKPARA